MNPSVKEISSELVYLLHVVKDYIHVQAQWGDPSYKWLDESWSTHDIMETMVENKLYTKEATIKWLLDLAHLFGKDRV